MNELQKINEIVDFSAEQFVTTIGQYKWDLIPDSQLLAAKAALTKSDFIMGVAAKNPGSVHDSLMRAAILGLDLTEGKKQGWLLPRRNKNKKFEIVLQPGYKGIEAIHQKLGVIDRLSIRVVYKNDIFEWTGDDKDKPTHTAIDDEGAINWFAPTEKRGKLIGAFIVTYYPDGTSNTTVTSIEEIFTKHRDKSDSYKDYTDKKKKGDYAYPPPWVSNEKEMIEKTMTYIAAKQWPANIRNADQSSKIIETLAEIDYSDYSFSADYTPQQKDAFFSFIEDKDGLGMYLFNRRVENETKAALYVLAKKMTPRGGKLKKADEIGALHDQGEDMYHNILSALDSNDETLLLENIEGAADITIKMLKKKLTDVQISTFEEMRAIS